MAVETHNSDKVQDGTGRTRDHQELDDQGQVRAGSVSVGETGKGWGSSVEETVFGKTLSSRSDVQEPALGQFFGELDDTSKLHRMPAIKDDDQPTRTINPKQHLYIQVINSPRSARQRN